VTEAETIKAPVSERQISMSNELLRKGIHLGSISIPVIYSFISRTLALEILIPLTLFSVFVDVGRHYIPGLKKIVNKVFDPILREHEREGGGRILLSGATYVLISALFCVLVFPKMITITAFAILIVSDASSAIIGRAFGKHRFFDKSLEGTLAFVVSAWLTILFTPKAGPLPMEYVIACIAAVVGGVVEAASVRLRFDDNFSVPATIGFLMWGSYFLLSILDPATYGILYQNMLAMQ